MESNLNEAHLTANMKLRTEILFLSLNLEKLITELLSALLSIEESKSSISFGNTSKALSFNQKVNLLIDIGALEKNAIKKYEKFMEVRNKFMHTLEINSFEECDVSSKGELKNFLLKNYPESQNENIESQLRFGFNLLHRDIAINTNNINTKIIEKRYNKVNSQINERFKELYQVHFGKIFDDATGAIERVINNSNKGDSSPKPPTLEFYIKWIKGLKKGLEESLQNFIDSINS